MCVCMSVYAYKCVALILFSCIAGVSEAMLDSSQIEELPFLIEMELVNLLQELIPPHIWTWVYKWIFKDRSVRQLDWQKETWQNDILWFDKGYDSNMNVASLLNSNVKFIFVQLFLCFSLSTKWRFFSRTHFD